MKIYTRKGDDGTTGLLFGGRVTKDSQRPMAYGEVDEAQASIGVARAVAGPDHPAAAMLLTIERDLWVLMSELATETENRHKLTPGSSLVTEPMVSTLEEWIDSVSDSFEPPTEFVVPGEAVVSAHLDVARTVVRRAERAAVAIGEPEGYAVSYLNRLSDLLWTLARADEPTAVATRSVPAASGATPPQPSPAQPTVEDR